MINHVTVDTLTTGWMLPTIRGIETVIIIKTFSAHDAFFE